MLKLVLWALACAFFGVAGLVILAGFNLFDAAESTGRGVEFVVFGLVVALFIAPLPLKLNKEIERNREE